MMALIPISCQQICFHYFRAVWDNGASNRKASNDPEFDWQAWQPLVDERLLFEEIYQHQILLQSVPIVAARVVSSVRRISSEFQEEVAACSDIWAGQLGESIWCQSVNRHGTILIPSPFINIYCILHLYMYVCMNDWMYVYVLDWFRAFLSNFWHSIPGRFAPRPPWCKRHELHVWIPEGSGSPGIISTSTLEL